MTVNAAARNSSSEVIVRRIQRSSNACLLHSIAKPAHMIFQKRMIGTYATRIQFLGSEFDIGKYPGYFIPIYRLRVLRCGEGEIQPGQVPSQNIHRRLQLSARDIFKIRRIGKCADRCRRSATADETAWQSD